MWAVSDPTHLVLIPSYNTGERVLRTVRDALAVWSPVWVVVDGSTDGTAASLELMAEEEEGLEVFVLEKNLGKGAAVLHGARRALEAGFTDVLCMDADGQHAAGQIGGIMEVSKANPGALVLGKPVFGPEAPAVRVNGRKISNFWADVETLWGGIGDSLYGFRVYPLGRLIEVMDETRFARRFDFDVEVAVRIAWKGERVLNVDSPVKYLTAEEGGVSQFRYVRDNVLLTWMHARLMVGFLLRLPLLIWRKLER